MQDFFFAWWGGGGGGGGGGGNCMEDMYAECQICVRSLLSIL